MLKRIISLLLPVMTLTGLPLTKSYSRALENAQGYNRPMLVVFTGSDWSIESKNLLNQLEDEALQKKLGTSWIVCHLDFPEINVQPQEEVEQNFALKKEYNIDVIPTIALLSPSGELIAKTGFMPVAPTFLANHVTELYDTYTTITSSLSTSPVEKLKAFLLDARALNNKALTKAIIEEGLSREENALFALEKFQLLSNKRSDEASALLQLARAGESGLKNKEQEKLAWELFENRQGMKPLEQVQPLIQLVNKQKEGKLVWKLHSFLARFLHDAGEGEEASKHAQEAEKYAPDTLKKDLENLISNQ